MSEISGKKGDPLSSGESPDAGEKAREKLLKEKSARLHALCHQLAQGLEPQSEMAARWEAYWICNALAWDQMHTGQDWLGAAEGKLWRFKSQKPWKAFQEALAFSGSAPILGVKLDDAGAVLADDSERARVMVTWALPILLGDPGQDQQAFDAFGEQAVRTAAAAFAEAMQVGPDAELACAPQLLDPRKLRLLEQDRGGLRALWTTMAQPGAAPQASQELAGALRFETPHEHRWPALAWIVFGFWPKTAAASQRIFSALAPKLGPGCARGLDDAQEAASAILRAALKARKDEREAGDAKTSAPRREAATQLEQLDAQAEGLADFALFTPMPMGFALQTHEALTIALPAAAQLCARAMKRQGVESVGWVAAEDVAKSDEEAWKKGAVWALGRDGASALWNPSAWLIDMKGPEELDSDSRARIEAAFAAEGVKWRAPTRLKASHADALLGHAGAQAQADAAKTMGAPLGPLGEPLDAKAARDLALGELGLLDPRAMGAANGVLLSKQRAPKGSAS